MGVNGSFGLFDTSLLDVYRDDLAPSWANFRADARPMPEPAPVMMATLSANPLFTRRH